MIYQQQIYSAFYQELNSPKKVSPHLEKIDILQKQKTQK